MKNEEKIREIAYKRFPENISYSTIIDQYKDYNLDSRSIFIEGAEQMAAWKEEQMIEFLLKKQDEADDTTTASYIGKIIEDFKKAMENE